MMKRIFLFLTSLCASGMSGSAFAADPQTCSYNAAYYITLPAPGSGIISQIVGNIAAIVNNLAVGMYNGILLSPTFQQSAAAAVTLYIVIYGILFAAGLTRITLHDVVIRLVKLGVVAILLIPASSWFFFYNYLGAAFHDGKNELIGVMLTIATGGASSWTVMDPNNPSGVLSLNSQLLAQFPFSVLDNIVAVLTSSKMAITLIATFATGPYGIVIGILILLGLGSFIGALFQAMWVYLMSLVVTAFLFAVAPIFFVCLLFQRTRNLFDGWINQLVNATLQPVFLFTFFSFFSAMMWGAITRLLQTPVCWTPPGDVWRGTPFDIYIWRFMVNNGGGWQMYDGKWSFTGPDLGINAPVFPISIVDVLVLVVIAQLSHRFNSVVLHIAREIAGAAMMLEVATSLNRYFSPGRITGPVSQAFNQVRGAAQTAGGNATQQARRLAGLVQGRRPPAGGGGAEES